MIYPDYNKFRGGFNANAVEHEQSTYLNVEHPTANIQHRIIERLRRSIFISVLVATFFPAKKWHS